MKFTIEQRHLTDPAGRPVNDPAAVSFHSCEAETLEEAVTSFVAALGGEVIGETLKFPGFQAVATVRNGGGVFTLQIGPASQSFPAVD